MIERTWDLGVEAEKIDGNRGDEMMRWGNNNKNPNLKVLGFEYNFGLKLEAIGSK